MAHQTTDPSDSIGWQALPVSTPTAAAQESTARFRREFALDGEVVSARLLASAYGIFTAEVNGQAVSDEVLSPGWTVYTERLRYVASDVTALVKSGANAIGFTVAEGWYAGRIGFHGGVRHLYGDRIAAIAQLEVTFADGSSQVVASGADWLCGPSPVLTASLYDGETRDARLDQAGWSSPGFNGEGWGPVAVLDPASDRLVARVGPPVRRHERFAPTKIWRSPSGKTLVDFGQNMSGWVSYTVNAPAGTAVAVRHAEVLEHGELGTRPLREAAATDTYTCAGGGPETYEPSFTIHGFRYAEVSGWPGELTADDLEAVAVYSAIGEHGGFECSHEGLNQLHRNVVWSMKGNFVDIPTDCPQRDERLGWTGDIEVFSPTAAFLADVSGFLNSWLDDLAVEQRTLGTVPPYVPWVPLLFPPLGTAAWSDAAVIVPWVLYQNYGDVDALAHHYPMMKAWVDDTTSMSSPSGLWDHGFQFGDWLDPAAPPENPAAARTETALVATAYRAYSARLLAKAAAVLGIDADATHYAVLAAEVTVAFNTEFVTPSGRLSSDAQTAYGQAIGFDLLPTATQRARAGKRLAELVANDNYCIGTGFVGTPLVCDALADTGHIDTAYHLLLQTENPSWLYPVSMGATTIWERWDSMLPDGSINPGEMTSFNHYALGAVADFLHRRVAGLAAGAPGWSTIRIAPLPGGGLTHASAWHDTPHGRASVSWKRDGACLVVDAVVPPSTAAIVELPGQTPIDVGPGTHRFETDHRAAADDPPRPRKRHPFLPDEES